MGWSFSSVAQPSLQASPIGAAVLTMVLLRGTGRKNLFLGSPIQSFFKLVSIKCDVS